MYARSLVHIDRISFMTSLLQKLIYENVKGNIAEVGIYRGGTLYSICKKLKELQSNKTFYAVDTFEGHPYTDTDGKHFKGRYSDTSFNKILKIIVKNDFMKTRLIKGNFIEVAHFLAKDKFCFVHLDVDLEKSYDECVGFFKPRMVKGGIMFFDDYNSSSAKLGSRGIHRHIHKKNLIILPTEQAYWIKK